MTANHDTRVRQNNSRQWPDDVLAAMDDAPAGAEAERLIGRGLPQLATGYDRTGGPQGSRSLEQRIIAQILDETRVLIRPQSGEARAFLTFWTARFEMSNVKTLLRSKMTNECFV